jgi:hypothetical protein
MLENVAPAMMFINEHEKPLLAATVQGHELCLVKDLPYLFDIHRWVYDFGLIVPNTLMYFLFSQYSQVHTTPIQFQNLFIWKIIFLKLYFLNDTSLRLHLWALTRFNTKM